MPLQISMPQLSYGTQGADVARVQQALQALGRSLPVGEVNDGVLGSGTIAALQALQGDLGVPANGIVDAATIRAINARLAESPTDQRVVRGSVRRPDGDPIADGSFVQIFAQGSGEERVIGKSPLNAEGSYEIAYQLPADSGERVDLRVAVLNRNALVETIPSGTAILTNAGRVEVINFIVGGALNQPRSEFDLMIGDLKPLLGRRTLLELNEDASGHNVSRLAIASIYSPDQVGALALAHKLEKDTNTPAAVFYGLVRQGLPSNIVALQEAHPDVRLERLKAAVAQGMVPAQIGDRNIEDYLSTLVPPATEPLRGLLGTILNADHLKLFLDRYRTSSQDLPAFWKGVETDQILAARAAEVKFTVQLGTLTNNHQPLVGAIRALPDVKRPSDLVRLGEDKWKLLIQASGVGVPPDTPGATADDKTNAYVQQILRQVEAAFPTTFFAERLGSSPVAIFLKAQPSYDLKTTYPPQFFKDNAAASQDFAPQHRKQLEGFQRLYRLTGSSAETITLADRGLHSAQQIARMDRKVFAERHKDVLSAERAAEIYDKASRTSAVALALFGEHGAALNRTSMRALPKLDVKKQADQAAALIPDWQALFGSFDLCACRDCASVHGPAAYFVDILKFLGDRGVRDALFARRPDLGDVELSCENTDTVVPLVDLANEILEDAVAPLTVFAPFTLAEALESDLSQTVATAALSAAFAPPLQPGARVEVIEAGRRWRIWDEAFAYSLVKDGNALKVLTRSRQTTGTSEERRATPQYRNRAAYTELEQSVYPWSLPFNLPNDEASVFLRHLGTSRRDLVENLRPLPDPFDANAPVVVRLAAEALGLTDAERRILVGEALTPPRLPADFWGSTPLAELGTVRKMLDCSGIDYAELDALIATWFVDPAAAVTISAKSDAPVATCDTALLQINGLSDAIIDRLHRFVRLKRKLGWPISDLDRALRAFAPGPNTPALNNEILVRLDHLKTLCLRLRLSVAETLALWRPIGTDEPGSLYAKLFYNPTVFKPQDEAFRLRPDGRELARVDGRLADQATALQTVFRLSAVSLAPLLAKTNGKLTLANLSLIYRHAVLARQSRLSIDELLIAIDVIGIDPFRADRSQDTVRFVEVVEAVRGSGFRFPELGYLLRHRFNPAASFAPTDATLARTLLELRTELLAVDAPSEAEKQKLRQSAVIDHVSTMLVLPSDITAALVGRVTHLGASGLQRFLELITVTGESLSRQNAKPQFETLEKLLKTATIIKALGVTGSQLDWLFLENAWLTTAPDPTATPIPLAGWFSLLELQQVRQDLSLADAALEAILSAVAVVARSANAAERLAAKGAFIDALSQWLGWPQENLQTLLGGRNVAADLGILQARLPEDYRLHLIVRLNRAMGLLKRLGVGAVAASRWCEAAISDADAKAIRGLAKAKHDDANWQMLAPTLQDSLRDHQREALVSYLVARPSKWGNVEGANADDLFVHILIDVETCSCQLTSRIKQAIGSVQLFAQRCLLGLEPPLQTSDPKWAQWDWMKSYRVWEANRKIWLYPENWIEPDLRDDKTPFFKELESELLQSDLDDLAAEQAVMRYLEKLDEVARLDIVGVYEDETKMLHVIGRTWHTPHIHYYRRREGTCWTPWEKVELDIEGDHLIPVMWNRKLMLIWPIFNEKTVEKSVKMPAPNATLDSADRYWEIQLAWSEYRNGRWSGKSLSEPVTFTAYQGEDKILFGTWVPAPVNTTAMARRTNNDDDLPDRPPVDPGDGPGNPVPPRPPSSTAPIGPRRLVSKELISFKALVSGDSLVVRGFLRRDYRQAPAATDTQIAYPFGEFRFFGCRKIVTTAHNGQIARKNFALAPSSTKSDRMWFTQTGPALTLFDGQFPTFPRFVQTEIFSVGNEPASIAGDPTSTLVNKHDIPVLNLTPWAFRLLAPHQDLQFVCDRPFFFMDGRRTFMVSSTGSSGVRAGQLIDWVRADVAVAWRADYFPNPIPVNGSADPSSLTVLDRSSGGRRVARELVPVSLSPSYSPRGLLPTFWTTREYRFENFHHPYLCEFIETLNQDGLAALMSLATQSALDPQSFDAYRPEPRVLKNYPIDEVEFQSGRAYEVYNWELFFHIPLLIAVRLSTNQRFKEAQRWFHFIFDPTGASGGTIPQRYWGTLPFNKRTSSSYEAESVKTIEDMVAHGASPELQAAIEAWRSHPFSPHAVARLRTTAYQKTVVSKYIDNLIAWGDQLFRRDTPESVNEAIQLYVLAADILGPRPEVIDRKLRPAVATFNTLGTIDALGNALEQIELLIPDAGQTASGPISPETPDPPSETVLYFGIPENDKLLAAWTTVTDRLFKIRHCMNIEGQVRQLPLFGSMLDPSLLVRAQAAGLSIAEVLADAFPSLPNYRFAVMMQKAGDLVSEVRNLGALLMSALERRDAEALSTLRSGQEVRLLEAVRDVRVKQVDEANASVAALQASRDVAQARKDYYESRDFMSVLETTALALSTAAQVPLGVKAASEAVSVVINLLPDAKAGAPTTVGIQFGGSNKGGSSSAFEKLKETVAVLLNLSATVTGRLGEYSRRQDEWDHQANLAAIELKQIDHQLLAAQIRLDVAQRELRNHDQQVDSAREANEFLRAKFTNQDLFQWMIAQVSALYFQTFQLAYGLAKRAELCMHHEIGLKYGETSIIRFGYWDSLKKGLLAGDQLAHDLKRLDLAYLDANIREYELTKHVSLISLAPEQLIALKETGACEFDIPEWLFDLDTPGHYRRRLKMVSITIPCVTGPYTTIHCKARLIRNSYRQIADLAAGYDRAPDDSSTGPDARFIDDRKILEGIVTSTGQNDAGVFEPAMRDERYLPFEGAGAISRWRLELPTEFKTFNYGTISDVVMHLRYTARDGGDSLRAAATASAKAMVGNGTVPALFRLFSLRHEFPAEWHRFVSSPPAANQTVTIDLGASRFPYFVQGRGITVAAAHAMARGRSPGQIHVGVAPGEILPDPAQDTWTGQGAPGPWTFGTDSDPKLLDDVFIVLAYGAS